MQYTVYTVCCVFGPVSKLYFMQSNNQPLFVVLTWHSLFVNSENFNIPEPITPGGVVGHNIS